MARPQPGRGRDLVVMGASAGGVEALRALVAHLPADLPATVLVVLHVPRGGFSALPSILRRSGPLAAEVAFDGAPLRRGQIFVAPTDHHLLVAEGRVRLSRGPTDNGHRPAIDPLFRSAARAMGSRVIGVVLSGTLDDGSTGLASIAAHGGIALVQKPTDALYSGMPTSALELVPTAEVATAAELGPLVARHTGDDVPWPPPAPEFDPNPVDLVNSGTREVGDPPPVFACPTCQGGLYEIRSRDAIWYRCRIGHLWSPQSLLDEQGNALEAALWMALRSLAEKAALARRMAKAGHARGSEFAATRYTARAIEAESAAKLIGELIAQGDALTHADDTEMSATPEPDRAG